MVSEKSNGLGDYLDRLAAWALGRIPRAQPAIGDHSYGSYPRPIGEDWEPEQMTAPPGQEDQSQRDPAAEQLSTSPTGAVEPGPVETAAREPGGRKAGAAGVTDEPLPRMTPAPTGKGQPGSYAAGSQADLTKAAPATLPRQATTAHQEPSAVAGGVGPEPVASAFEVGPQPDAEPATRMPFAADSGDQPERLEQLLETGPTEATAPTLRRQAKAATGQPAASTERDQPESREQGPEIGGAENTLSAQRLPATIATGLDPPKVSSDIGSGGDIPPGPIQEPEFSPATGPARRPPGAQSSNQPYSAVPSAQSSAKGSQLTAESAPGDPAWPGPDLSEINRGSPMETSFTREIARPTGQRGGSKSQATGVDDEMGWTPPPNAVGGEPAIPAGGQHAPAAAESPGLRPVPQPPRPAGPPMDFSQGTVTTRPSAEAGDKTRELRGFPPVIDQSPLPSKPLAAAYPRARARVNAVAPRLRSEDPTAGLPPIEISIDRIEINSPPAVQQAPLPPPEAPAGPVLSLDDYLRQRDEGKA